MPAHSGRPRSEITSAAALECAPKCFSSNSKNRASRIGRFAHPRLIASHSPEISASFATGTKEHCSELGIRRTARELGLERAFDLGDEPLQLLGGQLLVARKLKQMLRI